jgi:uncharacterized protein (TIGR02270 family)
MSARSACVPAIVSEHVAEAAFLRSIRTSLLTGARVKLRDVMRFDERIAAHLDGVAVAADYGAQLAREALASPGIGKVFVAAIGALDRGDSHDIERLCALAEASPDTLCGLTSAFGWTEPAALRGIVSLLLADRAAFRQRVGITACAQHRVDPGAALLSAASDSAAGLRAQAAHTAGVLGRTELLSSVCSSAEEDAGCRFWTAWAAVLHRSSAGALDVLSRIALEQGPHRRAAFQLVLQAMSVSTAHRVLQQLGGDPQQLRWLIRGSGIVGDPNYVPWLISHVARKETARLAAEAFSLIAGVDLRALKLEGPAPEQFESGPNDDPHDPNVEMDEDDGLPWPDQKLIQSWWNANSHRFQPGVRYFMGEPLNRENCVRVLKEGFQRQRILAAHYLCLLSPGSVLFNTSAPAWRQQRLLAQMS